jgi:hypothetical protein
LHQGVSKRTKTSGIKRKTSEPTSAFSASECRGCRSFQQIMHSAPPPSLLRVVAPNPQKVPRRAGDDELPPDSPVPRTGWLLIGFPLCRALPLACGPACGIMADASRTDTRAKNQAITATGSRRRMERAETRKGSSHWLWRSRQSPSFHWATASNSNRLRNVLHGGPHGGV